MGDIGTQGKPGKAIAALLQNHKEQIALALPKHLTADRMARIALTEVRKNGKLAKANAISLFGAVIQAAQLGLEPGSTMGHCYLVPFKGEVNLVIGYRGMIDLARRSGQVISIAAHVVYANDQFSYKYGLNEDLHHVPAEDGRVEPRHVYAVARLVGGGVQFRVMTWTACMAVRDKSEGYQAFKQGRIRSNPWDSHPEEMAKKTVIRRLFKYLPVSVEIQRAVALDEMADAGVSQANAAIIDAEFVITEDEEPDAPQGEQPQVRRRSEKQAEQPQEAGDLASLLSGLQNAADAERIDYLRSKANESLQGSGLEAFQRAATQRMTDITTTTE